eukprot:9353-Heterococcus_DN1.PRE.1
MCAVPSLGTQLIAALRTPAQAHSAELSNFITSGAHSTISDNVAATTHNTCTHTEHQHNNTQWLASCDQIQDSRLRANIQRARSLLASSGAAFLPCVENPFLVTAC